MKRRDFLKKTCLMLGTVTISSTLFNGCRKNWTKPNVILIMGDDIGYSDIGCYGSEIDTKNLDRLAQNGIRFTQFTNMAKCNPTRSSLFTGLFLGEKQNSENARSIGNIMRKAGYYTGIFGKEHFDKWVPENCYAVKSFDESLVFWAINQYFNPPNGNFQNPFKYNGKELDIKNMPISKKPFYKTDVFTDYALRFLEKTKKKDKPFFLYLPYHVAHYPLQAREEDIKKYRGKYFKGWDKLREERFKKQNEMGILPPNTKLSPPEDNLYRHRGSDEWCQYDRWNDIPEEQKDELDREMAVFAAMIDRMDQNIGRIINKVKKMDELENTLIMYLSDNGSCPYKNRIPDNHKNVDGLLGTAATYPYLHPEWACAGNTPWRYYKQYGHEGGPHTQFIVHWPAVVEKNQITDQVGSVVDILPTMLDITNTKYPVKADGKPTPKLDGSSLAPIFYGKKRKQPEIIISGHKSDKRMVRVGDWKIVRVKNRDWELYNMAEDPSELNNLAKEKPEKVKEILSILEKWKKGEI